MEVSRCERFSRRGRKIMSRKTRYTDEPMKTGQRVKDFLPPPEELVFKEDTEKSLGVRSHI